MRSDAAPFGYIDDRENVQTGYCGDLADSLGKYLAQRLNISSGIEVIKLPSNQENRFELVRDNTVHLECESNTITPNKQGTTFSNPFLIGGTRFLVPKDNAGKVNRDRFLDKRSLAPFGERRVAPASRRDFACFASCRFHRTLAGIRVGVLQNSTTADFLQETYPQAEAVYFQGDRGRIDAIEAIANGQIDAFISDGVLLQGEIERQIPLKNYLLIPEKPLTCNFYGLILPKGENKWKGLVNDFIAEKDRELQNQWLKDYSAQTFSDADYCLNRRTK